MTEKENSCTTLIFLFLLSLLVFDIIAWDWWRHGPSSQLDLMILRHTEKVVSTYPGFSQFLSLAGILGNSYFLGTLVILGGFFLARGKDWPALLFLLIIVLLGNLLVEPVKSWFQRPRPLPHLPGARGFSFPSSSAYLAAVVYGSLAFLISPHTSKWWSKIALFLGALTAVILVGLSRLFLRLHWLTDVLGAYALASSWLLFNLLVYKKIQQKWRP
ncbi:MAG: phosphatase PAP2 family protein [Deltaproteobacteria bacterium]|nr:phosphatase PAP2 family protein [Deltaproteobacteria bacterium]